MQIQGLRSKFGGSGEIRTHGGRKPSSVFKTGAFNRSATLPMAAIILKKYEDGKWFYTYFFQAVKIETKGSFLDYLDDS